MSKLEEQKALPRRQLYRTRTDAAIEQNIARKLGKRKAKKAKGKR